MKNYNENLKYCMIKEAFQTYDKDNDGYIATKEMGSVMRALGQNLTDQEYQDLVKIYDREDTGKIEFTEFFHLAQQRMKEPEGEDELIEAFRLFDRANEGVVPADEIAHAMSNTSEKLSKEEIDEFIRAADVRGDGQINYEEFIKMMLAN
jgi:calmodulin